MPIVNIPEIGRVQFPDDMPMEEIQAESDRLYSETYAGQQAVGEQLAPGQMERLERGADLFASRRQAERSGRYQEGVEERLANLEGVAGQLAFSPRNPFGPVGPVARAAGAVAGAVGDVGEGAMRDIRRGGAPSLRGEFGRTLAGQPLSVSADDAVSRGLDTAGRLLPQLAAAAAAPAATLGRVTMPNAFAGIAGSETYARTGDAAAAMQAGAAAGLVPGVGEAGRRAAAATLAAAVERGLLDGGRTGLQRGIEVLASQGTMQAFMEGINLPAYIQATPEQRKEMLVENLAANVAFLGLDMPYMLNRGTSATQGRLSPGAKVGMAVADLVNRPEAVDMLRTAADRFALEVTRPEYAQREVVENDIARRIQGLRGAVEGKAEGRRQKAEAEAPRAPRELPEVPGVPETLEGQPWEVAAPTSSGNLKSEKPSQTITGSKVQMGTEMPVRPEASPPAGEATAKWDALAEDLIGSLDAFAPARHAGARNYDLSDMAQRFVDYARTDQTGRPIEALVKEFAKTDQASAGQIKKLKAAVSEVSGKYQPATKATAAPEAPKAIEQKATERTEAPPAPESLERYLVAETVDTSAASERVKAADVLQADLRKEAATLQEQIKLLERDIRPQRGSAYERSRIKKSAPRAKVEAYRELQRKHNEIGNTLAGIDERVRADRRLLDSSADARIINDPRQPMARRVDRQIRALADQQKPVPQALLDARNAEIQRQVLEKYPDATAEEIKRVAGEVERAIYFNETPGRLPASVDIHAMRRQHLDAVVNAPDVPKHAFSEALREDLNRYRTGDRPYTAAREPVEPLTLSKLNELTKRVREETERVHEESRLEQERVRAEEEALKAKEAKLLAEAQAVVNQAKRTGTVGGRRPTEVKAELLDRILQEVREAVEKSAIKLERSTEDPTVYTAVGPDYSARGVVTQRGNGKWEVESWRFDGQKSKVRGTMESLEDALLVVKGMAAIAPGRAVVAVPGDGVYRFRRDGSAMLQLWQRARGLDTSKGHGTGKVGGSGEAPPKQAITTVEDWTQAKEFHGLEPGDKIAGWSARLLDVARKLRPDAPEEVTVRDVEAHIQSKAAAKDKKTPAAPAAEVGVRGSAPAAPEAAPPRGTSGVGDPLPAAAVGMPPLPPGVPGAFHHGADRMLVALERMMPGQTDVPAVMVALENVMRVVGNMAPIRARRFYQRARGIYKPDADVVRLDSIDNIPTAAHEVAHAVSDTIFGGTGSRPLMRAVGSRAAIAELRALGRALYGSRKPVAGYTAEGFSELVRLWLTTEEAGRRAPAATAWLEGTLFKAHPDLAQAMQAARERIDIWRGQGAMGRAQAQMKDPPGRLAQLKDLAQKTLGKAAQVEEFEPLRILSEGYQQVTGKRLPVARDPYLLASAKRGSTGAVMETMVEAGMVDVWGNITGPGLKEALARVKPAQGRDFATYLWSRRAIERWGKGQNPGMALEDAQYLRAKLETPEFIDAASKWYQWWDGVLEYVKQASPGMNGALVDAIRAGSSNYAPLARVLDPAKVKGPQAGRAGGGLYRMHGSGLPIHNIFQQSLLVAEKMISRAHRDMVLESVFRLSREPGMGWLVEEVPRTRVMESVNIEKIREQLEAAGVDTSAIGPDELLKFATHLDKPSGTDPIMVRQTPTGPKWYQVPAKVFDLLEGLNPARLSPVADLLIGMPNRAFKMGVTGLRASFSLVTNPIRDLPTFMLQSLAGNPGSRAVAYLQSFGDIVRAGLGGKVSPEWQTYQQLGIGSGMFLGGDIQHARREARSLFRGRFYRKIASPVETLREILSFTEAVPRLAEMRLVGSELGWTPGQPLTPEQAIAMTVAAKRVTTDFSAAGSVGKIWNQYMPFYNATVQGTRGFLRAFKRDQGIKEAPHRALFTVLKGLALLTVPVIWNWWANKDKDWYQQLPWRERYLYTNVEGPDGEIVQVPRPPEWGQAFMVLPEMLLDSWYRQDPESATQGLAHLFHTQNPLGMPSVLETGRQQVGNIIPFFGRPIVPRNQLDLPPGEQRAYYSSELAKALGNAFPGQVSPRRVDAAVRSLFGGVGGDVLDAPGEVMKILGLKDEGQGREFEAADVPIAGRLFRRGGQFSGNNRVLAEFWDEYLRSQSRLQAQRLHQREGTEAVQPVDAREMAYGKVLNAYHTVIKIELDIAARTANSDARRRLYQSAARTAQQALDAKPKGGDSR